MSKNNYEKAKQLLQEYAACKQEKADMHERMKDMVTYRHVLARPVAV